MRWPEPAVVWKAIDAFLKVAYGGPPPSAVRSRLETLRALDAGSFYDSPVFERRGEAPPRGSSSASATASTRT